MIIEELNIDDYELINIKSITKKNRIIKMNDIQVEDNETFYLSNGILSHNSAISSFTEIRDPATQAGMPLRGKVLNVYGKSPIDAMENAEVADIFSALNLEFNEQMGDWIFQPDTLLYNITYESIFEVDKEGNSLEKQVVVLGTDRFFINKQWVIVEDMVRNPEIYRGYIQDITISTNSIEELSPPDYFHFRRPWDFRGFRKVGVPYTVKIGKHSFICNDIDEILVDGEWKTVSLFLKKDKSTKQTVTISKASTNSVLTRFHNLLKPAFNARLNFSKVYIATDADPDGSAINSLLVNLFHEYFPELYWDSENSFINRITFPMISATKGKKTLYYENRNLFEKAKDTGEVDNTWKISYFKGLGSMEKEDWEHVFNNLNEYSFKIIDDGHLDELMQIFFDTDAGVRKEWLAVK